MSKDVAAWLEGLGMGAYIPSFLENALDFDTIPLLTDSELRELGLPIGLRIKLKEAARRLDNAKSAALADTLASADTQRYIYALFCDIADSTALVNRLGPEGFHELLRAYQKACREPITKYEGFIDEWQGDGILALFGFPQAHDHAADFAVRAGMEIVQAARRIREPASLAVRVGIGCGECAISETDRGRKTAVGSAKYIAARLQAAGAPNQVYICRTTDQALSKRFLRQKELATLKGFEGPQEIYRVLEVREAQTRFSRPADGSATREPDDARQGATLTPLVGRRSELALLKERWLDVRDRSIGRTQYICGDPGVGKSRIVHELENWIDGTRHVTMRFQCLPYASQSPLFPVIQQITQLSGIKPTDSTEARRQQLSAYLSRTKLDREGRVDLLVQLLSRDDEPTPSASRLPQHLKAHTLGTLVDILYECASRAPVLCVLEDAQWIDPSTQELLDLAVSNLEAHPILILVTHRPDYRSHGPSLPLQLFVKPEVEEMLEHLLGQRELPHAIRERILAERIPLHIEEIARWAVSADVHRDSVVPASLRDSLMARLDRVPRESRQIVEIASVIGQKFSFDVLQHVSGMVQQDLLDTLDNLRQNEIVEPMEPSPASRYRFFHALLCDAAYELVTRSRKTDYHRRVAEYLETTSASASQPELLARHYAESGDFPRSIDNWIKGAERARKRYANAEAEGHLRCAEQLLNGVIGMDDLDRRLTLVEGWVSGLAAGASSPETPPDPAREVDEASLDLRVRRVDLFLTKRQLTVQSMLSTCCIPLHQYSSESTRIALEQTLSLRARARAMEAELGIEGGQSKEELQAMFGLWGHFWMTAQHDRALELAMRLLSRGEQLVAQQNALAASPRHHKEALLDVVAGHRSLGCTLFTLGDFAAAQRHLESTVNAVIPDGPGDLIVDPRLAAHLMLAWMLWILGEPDLALTHVDKAIAMSQASQDPYSQAFALYVASAVHLMREEYERSLQYAEESLAISRKYSIELYELYSLFGRGCANARLGRGASGLEDVRKGIRMAEQTNLRYMRAFMLGWRAELEADEGDIAAATSSLNEAFTHVGDVAGRAWEAELHRIAGRFALLTVPPNPVAAKRSFSTAREIAQRQGARSFELRATIALARLFADEGAAAHARLILQSAVQIFDGSGLDTPDLLRARRQLEQWQIGESDAATSAN